MLSSTINNLIRDLKPRQKEVIVCRFGLENNERETLAEVGERYGITRERVRQIEAESLRKIKEEAERERLNKILERIFSHLDSLGGVRRDDILIDELRGIFKDNDIHRWHLHFLSEITEGPHYYFEDENFHSFWYAEEEVLKILKKFVNHLERIIASKKEDLIVRGKFDEYLSQIAKNYNIPESVGMNYVSVSRKFKVNPFGDFGLSDWEEINPKTMGSKAYLVIKKHGKPLHFREVAEFINKMNFDEKKALAQTIHNELIKDPRFVLVGRGSYALKEHGFVPGTAKEIIAKTLKSRGPMALNDVINSVSEQRLLKKNTIILNLQNKKLFKKLPDGKYAVLK
ncbi:hypothetical protein HY227_02880 [Candidatus Wolfebacteria bacterium]|nr:hypothetical protein [Candidatus Wolfebacteria bacterium]